ncbi:AraC family transcriptional regulator [Streptomyces solincola]|uniref:AraC family transcriptional regulator n=1 Tax=Streptomyces solincola TaxID=2100817 RepID=A0A2S9PSQ8_9ACTN|nr:AraC family transcriptional regulator [Streptomyces solincola]PRH77377.1 AraC family transcriptional regulator [Streptomyces solincola]
MVRHAAHQAYGAPGGVRGGAREAERPGECQVAAGGHGVHVHDFHQFLYAPVGRITVSADGRDHELSPAVALWVPAGVAHSARFDPDSLVIAEDFGVHHRLPYARATRVNVGEAQRRLLLARTRSSHPEPDCARVFAALTAGRRDCLPLPQPVSGAARAVAGELLRRPHDPRTATEWAESLYVSSTSLRRAFRAETGLAFSEWRTRVRLNRSLDLLAQGLLVGTVASRVGFVSTNGYILAFRRHFGSTPGAYARRRPDGAATSSAGDRS